MAQKTRVVRAKSWEELPEVLEPGVYEVNGEMFTIVEPIERDIWRQIVKGIKRLHRRYYGY